MKSESGMHVEIGSIMTVGPVAVTGDSTLDEARTLMDEHAIRHLPVLEGAGSGQGRLVGVISDRDVLEATDWLPARVHEARGGTTGDRVPRRVREIAHHPVHCVGAGDTAAAAALQLVQRRIGCLPVVEDDVLIGIVTETDLLHAYAALRPDDPGNSYEPVGEHMVQSPSAIHWFTSLGDAVALCRANAIRHLPVLEGEDLAGIVSDRDLRRALGAGRHAEMPVDEIVTREVVTIDSDAPLFRAAELMARHRFGCLPVVRGDSFVGLLTSTDLLERCLESLSRGH